MSFTLEEERARLSEALQQRCRELAVELAAAKHRALDEARDNDRLRVERDAAFRERDLAIAHDRQPYPTAEAYEKACAALAAAKTRITTLEGLLGETRHSVHAATQQPGAEHRLEYRRALLERVDAALIAKDIVAPEEAKRDLDSCPHTLRAGKPGGVETCAACGKDFCSHHLLVGTLGNGSATCVDCGKVVCP